MKINVYNSARPVSLVFTDFDGREYEDANNLFSSVNEAIEYARVEIEQRLQASSAHIYDTNTGELYVTCYVDEPEYDAALEWDDCDNDCGFDPYEGAFTWDC